MPMMIYHSDHVPTCGYAVDMYNGSIEKDSIRLTDDTGPTTNTPGRGGTRIPLYNGGGGEKSHYIIRGYA